MSREHLRLPMHGRDHLPGGSDPIPTVTAATYAPNPAYCRYTTPVYTVSPGSAVIPNWTVDTPLSGAGADTTLLNLTTPAGPRIVTQGVYVVNVTFSTTTPRPSWTAGSSYNCQLDVFASDLQPMISTVTIDPNGTTEGGFVSVCQQMKANDLLQITLINNDSGARDLCAAKIWVQRICVY